MLKKKSLKKSLPRKKESLKRKQPLRKKSAKKEPLKEKKIKKFTRKDMKNHTPFTRQKLRDYVEILLENKGKITKTNICQHFHIEYNSLTDAAELFVRKEIEKFTLIHGLTKSEQEKFLSKRDFLSMSVFNVQKLFTIKACAVANFTKTKTAQYIGVDDVTFNNWLKTYPIVKRFWVEGREGIVLKVTQSMVDRATGYDYKEDHVVSYQGFANRIKVDKHKAPDVNAAKLVLLNKSDWKIEPTAGNINADHQEIEWDVRKKYYTEEN